MDRKTVIQWIKLTTLRATSFSPCERGLQTAAGTSVVTEVPFGFVDLADDSTFGQGLVEESLTSADADCTRHFPLVKEDADFAVIRVLLPDVVPQLLEAALHAPVTDRAANVEQSSHCFLQSTILEAVWNNTMDKLKINGNTMDKQWREKQWINLIRKTLIQWIEER